MNFLRVCISSALLLWSSLSLALDSSFTPTFDSSIPVVDIADFNSGEPARHDHFMHVLKDALVRIGFFGVIDSSVNVESLHAGYDAAKQFFALSADVKESIYDPKLNAQRGWVPSESAKGEKVKDWKEYLHIGPETMEGAVPDNLLANLWPQEMDLRSPMLKLHALLDNHGDSLKAAMSEALGQEPGFLHTISKGGDNLMRVLYYPKNPPAGIPLAAAHTDIDLFTILPLATEEGLELKAEDGTWLPVRVPAGAFIVNAGDMLTNLSNGMFKSAEHRVVASKTGRERYSIVYFVHPPSNADMSPIPSAIALTGGVRLYPSATRIEMLAERLAELGVASKEIVELLSSSGLEEQRLDLGTKNTKAMNVLKSHGLATDRILKVLEESKDNGEL